MLAPDTILMGLTALANEWRALAIMWHILLGALLVMLMAGRRPSARFVAHLLVAPLVSVGAVAWLSGNPFNGTVFAVLAVTLARTATRLPNVSVRLASSGWIAAGVAFIAFGWTYPHFLRTDSWTTYLYAAPFGLLPCPTLSAVIGTVLLFQNLRSRIWNTPVAMAGLFVTWVFVLEDHAGSSTRLIVRARGGKSYRFCGLPPCLSALVVRSVHFVMQRKQLIGIAQRVESSGATALDATPCCDPRRWSA